MSGHGDAGATIPRVEPAPTPRPAEPDEGAVDLRLVAALLALTLAAYFNSLPNGFAWDDTYVLVKNGAVQSLAHPARFFTDPSTCATKPEMVSYRPLRTLTWALVHEVAGLDPLAYHLVNVSFHLGSVGLLCALLPALRVPTGPALLVAGLFGVHPIQTEAVASVTGLTDVMSGFFYLASLLGFVRAVSGRRRAASFALCWLSFAGALASKEMALSLPLVAALVAVRLGAPGQRRRRGVLLVAVLALTALGWMALRFRLMGRLGYDADLPGGTVGRTALMQAEALAAYVRLLLFPSGLSVRHVIDVPLSAAEPRVVLSLLVVAGLVAWLVLSVRRRADEALGLAWFWLTLIPVMNVIPLPGDLMGERFLYLPMIGFALAVVTVAGRWLASAPPALARWAAGLALVALATATAARNRDWKDDLTLFESAVRVSPTSNVVRFGLAGAYARSGRAEEAAAQLEAVRRNARAYSERYVALGDGARDRQDGDEARLWYVRALRASPGDPVARKRLAELGAGPGLPAR